MSETAAPTTNTRTFAHGTDFRIRETVIVEQYTTTDITAEVLS